MECHGAVFVEPTPEFDVDKKTNWQELADLIFKAAEKEENVRKQISDGKVIKDPEKFLYKPFERLKDCVNCTKFLQKDMQLENILDRYELRQDATQEEKENR